MTDNVTSLTNNVTSLTNFRLVTPEYVEARRRDQEARNALHDLLSSPELLAALNVCEAHAKAAAEDEDVDTPTACDELERAATFVFGGIHDALVALEGLALSANDGRRMVHHARDRAKVALRRHYDAAAVNRLRRDACGGGPMLMVCYGVDVQPFERGRLRRKFPHGYIHLAGDGCGVVCHDSTTRLDKVYCDACSRATAVRRRKLEARVDAIAGRKVQRLPYLFHDDERGDFTAYEGPCASCRRMFANTRPDVIYCDTCSRRNA